LLFHRLSCVDVQSPQTRRIWFLFSPLKSEQLGPRFRQRFFSAAAVRDTSHRDLVGTYTSQMNYVGVVIRGKRKHPSF
jgi:hypothetical protein